MDQGKRKWSCLVNEQSGERREMMKGGQDGVAIFGAAIAALEQEAVDLERRAAAARALIQQLRDHAGIPSPAMKIPHQNRISKPDPPKAAPGHRQAAKKRPSVGSDPPAAKLTAWRQDETGALSRELSAT
jgi:hypothetical protein